MGVSLPMGVETMVKSELFGKEGSKPKEGSYGMKRFSGVGLDQGNSQGWGFRIWSAGGEDDANKASSGSIGSKILKL